MVCGHWTGNAEGLCTRPLCLGSSLLGLKACLELEWAYVGRAGTKALHGPVFPGNAWHIG